MITYRVIVSVPKNNISGIAKYFPSLVSYDQHISDQHVLVDCINSAIELLRVWAYNDDTYPI